MCYTSGPRCSPHAQAKLSAAQKAIRQNVSSDPNVIIALHNEVKSAQKEYWTSPAGIKELKAKADDTGKIEDINRAGMFEKRRKDMISRSKVIAKNNKLAEKLGQEKDSPQVVTPIISEVKNSKLHEPVRQVNNGYFMSDKHLYSVEYEYDGYYCSGSSCNSDGYDDYCRDSEYDNIRVADVINTRAVLAEIYRCKSDDIPDDLVEFANNELELDDKESYEVQVSGGYYGDEASVVLSDPKKVYTKLREYYFARDDAKDDHGVLPYVRGKGIATKGMSPLDAIKTQLRSENKGMILSHVENATVVERKQLNIKEVIVPQNEHFIKVDPRKPLAPHGAEETLGVVVQKGDSYVLVDGYHRFKHQIAKETKAGSFIVLS